MGTAVRPAKTSPGLWDAFADANVFVDEVLAELGGYGKGWRLADAIRAKAAVVAGAALQQGRHGGSGVFVSVACSGGRSD